VAANHPFIDGNKRIVAVACEAFIVLNGGTLAASDLELYPIYISLAEGALAEADFAAWLRQHMQIKPGKEVHEKQAPYAR
jgi:death-on-curing protein